MSRAQKNHKRRAIAAHQKALRRQKRKARASDAADRRSPALDDAQAHGEVGAVDHRHEPDALASANPRDVTDAQGPGDSRVDPRELPGYSAELARTNADVEHHVIALMEEAGASLFPMRDRLARLHSDIAVLQGQERDLTPTLIDPLATDRDKKQAAKQLRTIAASLAQLERTALGIQRRLRGDGVSIERTAVRRVSLARRRERESIAMAKTKARAHEQLIRERHRTANLLAAPPRRAVSRVSRDSRVSCTPDVAPMPGEAGVG
jgi:hypothetical protein